MPESRKRIGRLAVELLVVVLGVLIALAADSWWSERNDRQRARAYLDAISQDFREAEVELEASIVGIERQVSSLGEFIDQAGTGSQTSDTIPMPSLGSDGQRFFAPTGMLDALLTTGDIALLRPELRSVLIREHAEIHRRTEQMDRFADLIVEALRDLILPLNEARLAGRAASGEYSARAILGSAQALTGLARMQIAWSNQLGEQRRMLESIQAVRAATEEALESGEVYLR